MTVEYVGLADYVAIAAEVTGLEVETILRFPRLDLADSALHAPAAGVGDTEFYPDLFDIAAVLIVHLAKNHPLPDGNKRAAWVAMRVFLEVNGWTWRAALDVDDAERAVVAVASGEWDHQADGRLAARPSPAARTVSKDLPTGEKADGPRRLP